MPKRKRGDLSGPVSGVKQQRISHKLHYTTNRVAHAFKVAKGFERRKLSRRQKKAQEEADEQAGRRIEAEIVALKELNLRQIAQLFYLKYLHKNKDISKSALFKGLVDIPEVSIEGARQNVVARLCNTQPVKKAFQDGHDDVLNAAGVPLPKLARKDRGRMNRLRDRAEEPEVDFSTDDGGDDDDDDNNAEQQQQQQQQDKEARPSKKQKKMQAIPMEVPADGTQWVVDEVGFGDTATTKSQQLPKAVQTKLGGANLLLDEDESDPHSEGSVDSLGRSNKKRTPTSVVLPSLTTGYISGSDGSDIEDIDDAARKNRPGQRARQAIWEKKYGAKAKHLQKASRDRGWDPKRGATDAGDRGHRHAGSRPQDDRLHGGKSDRHAVGSANGARSETKTKRDDSGPLHPSWEAAKHAKAKTAAIPAFAGKKISFD